MKIVRRESEQYPTRIEQLLLHRPDTLWWHVSLYQDFEVTVRYLNLSLNGCPTLKTHVAAGTSYQYRGLGITRDMSHLGPAFQGCHKQVFTLTHIPHDCLLGITQPAFGGQDSLPGLPQKEVKIGRNRSVP